MTLTLTEAQSIIRDSLAWRAENGLKPLTVAVLDSGGHLVALAREDGTSTLRPEIAQAIRPQGGIGDPEALGAALRLILRTVSSSPAQTCRRCASPDLRCGSKTAPICNSSTFAASVLGREISTGRPLSAASATTSP